MGGAFKWTRLFNEVAKLADAKGKVKWLLAKCHCIYLTNMDVKQNMFLH